MHLLLALISDFDAHLRNLGRRTLD
ncbi:MAG: hypothetical protein LZF62_50042 [Nitrospira sp.]|nr:MAG: hypothetical protein LZF62_50042 [Nitrospira sp.]